MERENHNNAAHNPEMDKFNEGLRRVLSVSKADLNRMLAEEKAAMTGKVKPGPKPRTSASVRDSDAE